MSSSHTSDELDPANPTLECGRDALEVVDRARASRSTEHETTCPYCRAAIENDRLAGTATVQLAAAERDDLVPATLLPQVMRSVWSDLRRSATIPLATDAGSAFVTDRTVAAVVENALDQLVDLRVHTCTARLVADEAESGTTAAPAGSISLAVRAAAEFDVDLRAVAVRVRDLARHTVAEQFGWAAGPIDIEIVDVYLPGTRS